MPPGPDAESHKRRTPAWCDRVLWWTRAGAHDQAAAAGSSGTAAATLKQLGYWRGELAFSDHRPVSDGRCWGAGMQCAARGGPGCVCSPLPRLRTLQLRGLHSARHRSPFTACDLIRIYAYLTVYAIVMCALSVPRRAQVSSLFSAQVVSYDRPKIESLLEAALRAVDLMQQSMRPK